MIFMEPEESIGKWKQTLSEHLGDDAALLTGKVAELALLTGAQPTPEDMGPLEERTRFKSVLEQLLSLLAAPGILWFCFWTMCTGRIWDPWKCWKNCSKMRISTI